MRVELERLFERHKTVNSSVVLPEYVRVEAGEVSPHKIDIREYALTGWKDTSPWDYLEAELQESIIFEMFGIADSEKLPGSMLFWRVYPEYVEHEDFPTGRLQRRIYLRLGWDIPGVSKS